MIKPRRGPSWAAWIEITTPDHGVKGYNVAVPRGPRGLKSVSPALSMSDHAVAVPRGPRGLKSTAILTWSRMRLSRGPSWAAWIEMLQVLQASRRT